MTARVVLMADVALAVVAMVLIVDTLNGTGGGYGDIWYGLGVVALACWFFVAGGVGIWAFRRLFEL